MMREADELVQHLQDHLASQERREFSAHFIAMVRDGGMPFWRIDTVDFEGSQMEILLELRGDTPVRAFHLRGHRPQCHLPDGILGVSMPIEPGGVGVGGWVT